MRSTGKQMRIWLIRRVPAKAFVGEKAWRRSDDRDGWAKPKGIGRPYKKRRFARLRMEVIRDQF
jgi:hypothetical protein